MAVFEAEGSFYFCAGLTKAAVVVILIDWSQGGHNATHLQAFGGALQRSHHRVEFVAALSLAATLREFGRNSEDDRFGNVHEVEWPGFVPIRPRTLQHALRRRGFARRIANGVAAIRESHPGEQCVLYFSCLFEQDFDLASKVADLTGLPWSFLYLHPYLFADSPSERFVKQDAARRVLQHRNLVGIATMNEDVVDRISSFCGKPVITFPEITDENIQQGHPLEQRFRRFAQERTLVVTAGYLGAWKGVGLLSRVCMASDPERFAFLFAGPMPLETFRTEDREVVERCLDSAPHALFHLARVPDGEPYNAILQAADVIFAAFENFPFSSNTLTKASLLRKPVIVSDGGLSAKRVREFNLGVVVPFGDVEAVLEAVESFASTESRRAFGEKAQWDDYLEIHGPGRLDQAFRELCRFAPATDTQSGGRLLMPSV